jgi:murein DD-endopeptidase MepM/ murein hydrolase activator NlpD
MGRHSKPNDTTTTMKKIALATSVGVGAAVVPATFAAPASAATVDQWDRIAKCESGGLWNRPDGDGGRSSGGLQFQPASWNDALAYLRSKGVDTSAYPQGSGHQAYKATKQQQIIAGEALLALQGAGAWTCNALSGYPLGTGKGASMFMGGPNPYPAAPPTTTPPPTPKPTPEPPDAEDGVYVVKAGDYLAKIATALKIEGGWKALYEINKSVIGSDPAKIFPGQKLRLPGHEAVDPYQGGLPKAHEKTPSAKALQTELKRTGYMANGVQLNDNYGPLTRAAVAHFHRDHPEYRSSWNAPDVQIGPRGWAHLRSMKGHAAPTAKPTPTVPATPKSPTSPPASTAAYVLPVRGTIGDSLIIGSGGSMSRSAGGHSGLDITAPQGTPVVSAAAGVVVSRNSSGAAYGYHVVVKHPSGVYTLYAHLSAITVSVGQSVAAGQQVGNVGSTGNSSGPHLHFEVRNHPTDFTVGTFLNPLTWLRSHGVTV